MLSVFAIERICVLLPQFFSFFDVNVCVVVRLCKYIYRYEFGDVCVHERDKTTVTGCCTQMFGVCLFFFSHVLFRLYFSITFSKMCLMVPWDRAWNTNKRKRKERDREKEQTSFGHKLVKMHVFVIHIMKKYSDRKKNESII